MGSLSSHQDLLVQANNTAALKNEEFRERPLSFRVVNRKAEKELHANANRNMTYEEDKSIEMTRENPLYSYIGGNNAASREGISSEASMKFI